MECPAPLCCSSRPRGARDRRPPRLWSASVLGPAYSPRVLERSGGGTDNLGVTEKGSGRIRAATEGALRFVLARRGAQEPFRVRMSWVAIHLIDGPEFDEMTCIHDTHVVR